MLDNVYYSVPSYGDKYGYSLLKVTKLHRLFGVNELGSDCAFPLQRLYLALDGFARSCSPPKY